MSERLDDLLAFLGEATSPFHAVTALSRRLQDAGFTAVEHLDNTSFEAGQGYFVTANDSSIVAFRAGSGRCEEGLRMIGAHTDSPNLSVKPNPLKQRSGTQQLAVDVYGGALLNPWFDRDLSLAGRVSFVNSTGDLASRLIDFRRPIAIIPSLAIHLDREANKNRSINPQTDILPLIAGLPTDEGSSLNWGQFLAGQLGAQYPEEGAVRILDFELSLYDCQPPGLVGIDEAFFASARLDNLLSCHAGLTALLAADPAQWSLLVCNDHEEVGSTSAVGAQGPMLVDVLNSITGTAAASRRLRERSKMLSVDNAHAVHPNFSDRHDEAHGPLLNQGPVVKINRNQRYATSGEGSALLRLLAERAEVPLQHFVVRSDMGCGSTIGPITAAETGITTIDLGVPTLAMHSIRELAGTADIDYLGLLLTAFYNRVA
jgi:aspartyl aminopeptidase